MKSINQVTLLGNLTRDPELRYTPQGTPVIGFGMVTNYSHKDKLTNEWKDMVDYHNVVFWGKSAEIISQYLTKGKKICVQGRLQTRNWKADDGTMKYKTEVVGRDFILLSPKEKVPPTQKLEEPNKEKNVVSEEKAKVEKMADDVFGDTKPEPIKDEVKIDPNDIPF